MVMFHGYVDVVDRYAVQGWASPPDAVKVFVNGVPVGHATVTAAREDARAAGQPNARGFLFRLSRHLKPGGNRIVVTFSDGSPVPAGDVGLNYDPGQIIDDHWSDQYSNKIAPIVRWWQSDLIVRHVNERVCGEQVSGLSQGLYRWLLRDFGPLPLRHGVSVGCGEGVKEIEALRLGLVEQFDLFELSAFAIEAGRKAAEGERLADRMVFHHGDALERLDFYDLVFWNNSLHHMPDVHAALSWSRRVLRPGGLLVMDEYVGPSRMQFPQWVLDANTSYRQSLPPHYKLNPYTHGELVADKMVNASIDDMIYWDPSEAADSSNIISALKLFFPDAKIRLTGGMIYHLGLNDILHNIHDNIEEIRRALALDDQLTERGVSQYAVAVART
jgi:SAM-dependent methyltransferase